MGNYRSGNKYRVAIGLETFLGSGNTHSMGGTTPTLSVRWEDLTVMPVKLELSPDRQMIDTDYKTGTSQATAYEQVQGVTDGTFTRYRDWETDRKSTRLNSSHRSLSRMPSSA